MIRIVTRKRLALLEADTHAAFERARLAKADAAAASDRHALELSEATDRSERAETTGQELGVLLIEAVRESAAAQEQLLLLSRELRCARAELVQGPKSGDTLTVLLHFGEPHTVYRTLRDAHADTATHGASPDAVWKPCGERPASAFRWRCEAFVYDAASNGFRRAFPPVAVPVRGAA
ncbi:hypothetical protein N4G70_16565 [Streptomyces sp. ASQP_92]|uniref:hypothetical protein n=1 Tax=Streptomyces sp. ASQP_92 TaxID=2979116 RepID=UPI0021C20856|nr:hypothetical protein [Streptomyces sp. ASQP_92]MCT9090467.1 hypothetical protein [Streptomyces sp. ASQP_92]